MKQNGTLPIDGIMIFSDNVYVKEALHNFIKRTDLTKIKGNLAIFIFEKKWLTCDELDSITECQADRIMIVAPEVLLSFIKTNVTKKIIKYCLLNQTVDNVKSSLNAFFENAYSVNFHNPKIIMKAYSISHFDKQVLMFYVHGATPKEISIVLGKHVKVLSAIKRKFFTNYGFIHNIEFIHFWPLIRKLEAEKIKTIELQKLISPHFVDNRNHYRTTSSINNAGI